MENKSLIPIIISVVVSVVIIASILMPIISTYTNAELTYTNNGTPFSSYDGETHTIIISIDSSNNITITTDGESCEMPTGYKSSATLVFGEEGYARMALSNGNIRVYVSESADSLTPSVGNDVTITVAPTSITINKGPTTYTADCKPLAYISHDGDYVLTTSPNVIPESVIYLGGTTTYTGSNFIGYVGYGTIEQLTATSTYSKPNNDTSITVSSVTAVANTTPINGDLVKVDNVVFTATLSDDSTLDGTFSYFLAPKVITYADPNYVGDTLSSLLNVIPLLVIISVLILTTTVFIGRRE